MLWLGLESLAGKTILLHSEQGLGDTIQFSRFVSLVEDLDAKVPLEIPQALMSLLADADGSQTVISQGDALQAFDFHCPLMSLPLGIDLDNIPASVQHIACDGPRLLHWQGRLENKRPREHRPGQTRMTGAYQQKFQLGKQVARCQAAKAMSQQVLAVRCPAQSKTKRRQTCSDSCNTRR